MGQAERIKDRKPIRIISALFVFLPKQETCLAQPSSYSLFPRPGFQPLSSLLQGEFPMRCLQCFHSSAMLLLLIPVLGIIFALRDARAQSVSQPDYHVILSEGASLELRCNYSYGGTVTLFWYVQNPGQDLQLLLKYYSGDTLVKGIKGFEAEFMKSRSSFNLRKPSVQWSDTAEYFCAVKATVSGTAKGAEHKLCKVLGGITASERF
uniref:Ig-like domain-containing protein n=1 Tax=Callithrix jacchus TaxID=9483 RepID=A0A8I3WS28_CALJA